MHQKGRPEHEGVIDIVDAAIIGEVHGKGAHQRIVVVRDLPALAIDIGQQPVAQIDCAAQRRIHLWIDVLEDIGLAFDIGAVDTHDRIKRRVLRPARIEFAIGRVLFASREPSADEEAPCVLRPVRCPGDGDIDAAVDLFGQCIPAGGGIAGP